MRRRRVVAIVALFGIVWSHDAAAQAIDVTFAPVPSPTTHPGNVGAWPLLVGSTAVGAWNLIQAPMGKSRMWSVTGIGLGLAATGYGKITLDNGTSTSDLAMGTMTAGIMTAAASTIALLPREGAAPQSELSKVQRGTMFGLTSLASIVGLLNFASNLEGSDQGLSAATVSVGLASTVFGVGAAAQAPQERLLARAGVISGAIATATGMITFSRHQTYEYPTQAFDFPAASTCRQRPVSLLRITF